MRNQRRQRSVERRRHIEECRDRAIICKAVGQSAAIRHGDVDRCGRAAQAAAVHRHGSQDVIARRHASRRDGVRQIGRAAEQRAVRIKIHRADRIVIRIGFGAKGHARGGGEIGGAAGRCGQDDGRRRIGERVKLRLRNNRQRRRRTAPRQRDGSGIGFLVVIQFEIVELLRDERQAVGF